MSKVISIGTALPRHRHAQTDILGFMQTLYCNNEVDKRKLRFLYGQSGIGQRYSVVPDFSRPVEEWKFFPQTEGLAPFPTLEQRMTVYNKYAPPLSIAAVRDCIDGIASPQEITHLITVSCTGMSAPGLDLQVAEAMGLNKNIFRTSVNFMGCYAAIHALKLAHALVAADANAKVVVVCTELCTIHLQREATADNMASALLFGDGSAAALIVHDNNACEGIFLDRFYSEIITKGKEDMAWELSSTGFLMTLSNYVPQLIEEDFASITDRVLSAEGKTAGDVSHWCIHPGGRRILDGIQKSMSLAEGALSASYDVLQEVGNLSSATILFVLKKIMDSKESIPKLLGAAFGPGLTVETFTAHRA